MMDCPCCGQAMPGTAPAEALKDANIGPTAKLIVEELARVYPRGITRRDLADRIYWKRPSGGPESAENVISVTISRTRPKLAELGWTVACAYGRGASLKLQRIDQ